MNRERKSGVAENEDILKKTAAFLNETLSTGTRSYSCGQTRVSVPFLTAPCGQTRIPVLFLTGPCGQTRIPVLFLTAPPVGRLEYLYLF